MPVVVELAARPPGQRRRCKHRCRSSNPQAPNLAFTPSTAPPNLIQDDRTSLASHARGPGGGIGHQVGSGSRKRNRAPIAGFASAGQRCIGGLFAPPLCVKTWTSSSKNSTRTRLSCVCPILSTTTS